MKQIVISHSGKQHAYHVAKALKDLNCLDKFYTTSYIKSEKQQEKFLKGGDTFWTRRFKKGLHGNHVGTNWLLEIPEFVSRKVRGNTMETQNLIYRRDVNFDERIAKELKHHKNASIFWGFQGSCHATLAAANQLGMTSICELATAHVVYSKQLLGEEQKLHPEWADSIDNLTFPSAYEKRLEEEPHRATYSIAASQFTKKSLLQVGIPEDKIIVLPLGAELEGITFEVNEEKPVNKPLKLLYCGVVTQRKGIKYLLEAMKKYNRSDVELHIIGRVHGEGKALEAYKDQFVYHPALAQHELFKQYQEYDALVLPTIFEGFGLVIVEAMAAGLPVITTDHSIGPEIIENGKNGYIVPIRDIPALQSAIEKLGSLDKAARLEMRYAARKTALEYSWNTYEKRLKKVIDLLNR